MAFNIFSSSTTTVPLLILLLCALSLPPRADADPVCGVSNFTPSDSYSRSLASLLSSLRLNASSSLYYSANFTGSSSLDTAFGMFQCRGDQTLSECSDCVSSAIYETVTACPTFIDAHDILDACTLMYRNVTITVDSIPWKAVAESTFNGTDSTFRANRDEALTIVTENAPSLGGYDATYIGTNVAERAYALFQCSGYLSQSECAACPNASGDLLSLDSYQGGRMNYGTNCYFRFENYQFYNSPAPVPGSPPVPSSPGGTVKKRILIGAILSSCLVIFCAVGLWLWKRKKSWLRREELQKARRLFSLEELEKATRNFDVANKLGAGGFGPVYKGVLENGHRVAIKKLLHPSDQGDRQFLSEVDILTTVRHPNLVILVGCCIGGSERLLIHEYLPNQSLDKHLFDAEGSTALSWSIRRDIITGTTKGLAYLHEESLVRTVHRDIKAANILLDDNLHPKIVDFGLARFFGDDQPHVTTRLAGTP